MKRFAIAGFVIAVALSGLIYSAVNSTAKAVVTVQELMAGNVTRERIRLGARVVGSEIDFQTSPQMVVRFKVSDPGKSEPSIPVTYYGLMPDTLKQGRDVILEGDFHGGEFLAKSLLTQCPSKYVPPTPKG